MEEVEISSHAFKHGLSKEDILYAWDNYAVRCYRGAPHEGEILAIGYDTKGRAVQLVGVERSCGVLIYHAMTPPTRNAMRELRLERRMNERR